MFYRIFGLTIVAWGVATLSAQLQTPRDPVELINFKFTETSVVSGLTGYSWPNGSGFGAGAAAADYDEDGDIDLFVPMYEGIPDRLYRNNGDGTFSEVAAQVGLASAELHRMALWLDYDDDGDLDLVVVSDCYQLNCTGDQTIRLYRQENPDLFIDVTPSVGLGGTLTLGAGAHCAGMSAGDIDNDGDLDLYIASWKEPSYLFRNNGNGTFTDVGALAGIDIQDTLWQPILWDFNQDGWTDLFLAIDFEPNLLFLNNQDGTFREAAAAAGVDYVGNDMGVALGDYDNDGDFDMYTTNIFKDGDHNVLFRMDGIAGDGTPLFAEVSQAAGVDDGRWGWGVAWLDANHDGWLDLATVNGFRTAQWKSDDSRFFLNRGGASPTFANVSARVNFNDTYWGAALAALDYDRDGDVDLLETCAGNGPIRLLRNDQVGARKRQWLTVLPRQSGLNKFAVGAVVRVTGGGLTQSRPILCGTSFLSQEPYEAIFGIPFGAATVDVEVIWPDGAVTQLTGVAKNQVIEITR